MRAVRLYDKLDLRLEEMSEPRARAGEVLVRIQCAFVCGTDVRMYNNGRAGISPANPRVLGHEFAGAIKFVGDGVADYTEGMRVAVAPNYGCGHCDRCAGGNTQLCHQQRAIGISVDGAFAEIVRIPARAVQQGNICVLPDHLSFHSAALAEPFSCVYNAYEKIGIFPGDSVLIIGAGPIGVMHAKMARLAGAGRIIMNDLSQERLETAAKIVPQIEPVLSGDLPGEIRRLTEGAGVDLVITAASVAAIQQVAFSLAGMNGRIMFFGGLPKGNSLVRLDTNEIHYKQLTVSGTTMQSLAQYRKILDLLASGTLNGDDIVTGAAEFGDVTAVVDQISRGAGLKTALTYS